MWVLENVQLMRVIVVVIVVALSLVAFWRGFVWGVAERQRADRQIVPRKHQPIERHAGPRSQCPFCGSQATCTIRDCDNVAMRCLQERFCAPGARWDGCVEDGAHLDCRCLWCKASWIDDLIDPAAAAE